MFKSNAEIKHVLEKKVVIAPKEVVEKPVPCCEAEKCKDVSFVPFKLVFVVLGIFE